MNIADLEITKMGGGNYTIKHEDQMISADKLLVEDDRFPEWVSKARDFDGLKTVMALTLIMFGVTGKK